MKSLVKAALQHTYGDYEFRGPKILVVGVGGAGNNSIHRLNRIGIKGAKTIAINTDWSHLKCVEADEKILIGKSITKGLGAGGYPAIGEQCAELARETLKENLSGANLVFLLAGMGGGTGTGAAPKVAEIAKKEEAIVVSMISTPFSVERARNKNAIQGVEKLRHVADSTVVLDNNKLLNHVPNLPIDEAFSVMDQLIAEVVKGITETITQPSLINLDYADVKTIMSNSGLSMMLYGEANLPEDAVKDAFKNPLLDVDHKGAAGALIHITGNQKLSLKDANRIAEGITEELSADANVIWGARINNNADGRIKVMSILTGVRSPQIYSG